MVIILIIIIVVKMVMVIRLIGVSFKKDVLFFINIINIDMLFVVID